MDSEISLIPDGNIYPSSTEPGKSPADLRLNGPDAWSPDLPADTAPFVVIDLDRPTEVTGVIVQGGGPNNPDEYVTLFTVEYSPDGINYYPAVTVNNFPAVRYVNLKITQVYDSILIKRFSLYI